MVRTNGWDPAVLERFREDPVVRAVPGAIDGVADIRTLEHIESLLPDAWLEPVAEAYRGIRPTGRFDDLAANPGSTPVR